MFVVLVTVSDTLTTQRLAARSVENGIFIIYTKRCVCMSTRH